MKTQKTASHISILSLWLLALGILGLTMTPNSRAGISPPYTPDFYTLHLWHLQDTNGTIPGVATNGVYFYDSQSNNTLVVPLLVSNTPGPNLIGAGTVNTNLQYAGEAGPGVPLYQYYGTNFGYDLSVTCTNGAALFAPWDNIGGNDYPDPSYALTNDASTFANTNTGAYTWEALVQFAFNPLVASTIGDANPEILCMDGPNSTLPGANPYNERATQFRIDVNTPANKNQAQLEWNGNITAPGGVSALFHDVEAPIPTTGVDQFNQGEWYHVAVAYTGSNPTNGDPPNVLTLYWTSFYPFHTNADVLTNFSSFNTLTNCSPHVAYAYPSNSIIGTSVFAIGGEPRLSAGNFGGGWLGNVAEVRISDYYRHSNEFMFNSTFYPTPPIVNPLPASTMVGYGQNFSVSLPVVAATPPYVCQWFQITSGVTNLVAVQTNSASLIVSNITYAANTTTYFAVITNAYGSTVSSTAKVTVGATFDGLFNTGCGPTDNPLDQTAPGSVDPHWMFPPGGNPDNNSPNAIVWSDGAPLASGGGVAPDNGASVWVWAHENSGKVANTYSLQTTFQVDETAVTTNTSISGTLGALGAQSGGTMQMFLNGVETDILLSGNPAESLYPFSITNGLRPGTNLLVCTAYQSGSGTAGNNAFDMGIITDIGVALTNAPVITNQPASTTNIYGSTVLIQAVALGAPPLYSYWLSNGVPVTPPVWVFTAPPYLSFAATNFSPSELVGTNFTAGYQVVFSNFLGSVTSAVANLDIQVPPPTLTSAGVPVWIPANSQTNIVVYFSTAVDPVTATTITNYSLTGGSGATVLSAVLGSSPGEVILTTTVLSPPGAYTLNVQNVQSSFGIAVSPSPSQIGVGTYPALALWLKASTGTVSDGSGGVGQWNDQSGNGNNFMSAFGPAFDPVLAMNAYGRPVVRFNGSNDDTLYANNTPSLQLTNDMSVFAVVNFATLAGGTNGEIVSETDANNIPAPYDYYANASAVVFLRGSGSGTPGSVPSTRDPSTGVPHILDVVMQGNNVSHRLDGNTNGTGTISAIIADIGQPIQIGTRGDGAVHLTGDMQELILTGQALSSNDVVSVENYLATEYNMPTGTNSYPVITQEPVAAIDVNLNGTLVVPAAASGTPAVAYQWYDASNIQQTGETNATLVISNDLVNDSYYLVATNIYGTATSSVVAVTLISGLNVSLGPPAITLYAGQSVTLTAEATGTAPFHYQWYQGASPIANATSASYTAVASSSSVNYSCTVTNSYNGYSSTNVGPVMLLGIAAPTPFGPTNLYQSMVFSNNPVAFWRLNEEPDNGSGNDGTIAHDYVGGHNGTYTNAQLAVPGFSMDSTDTAAVFGIFNSSPSNSYVSEIDNSAGGFSPVNFAQPTGANGSFSVEAWVCSSNAQMLGAGIVTKGFGNGGEQFDLDVYNGFRFLMRDASGTTHGPTLSTAPAIGKWYHVAGVFDGASGIVHLYTNGVDALDTTGIASGLGVLTATTTNALLPQTVLVSIGARASSQTVTNYDLQFQGAIEDVALYNYALSAAQVAADYQASGLAVASVNSGRTNIVFSVANNQLNLSWPTDHIGWTLQVQTNNLSVGISTNWINVSNSQSTNQVVVPVNLTNGSVFYRLIYTP